ncbi:MAG: hypothetical protein QOH36_2390 [Actinomycetota bacterium]|nr:hypothetical protein [Actinomycetota bacterium]
MRAFVTSELRRRCRADLVDDAVLVATELATNALLHAGGVTAVRVDAADGGVRIEVHDGTRVPPLMALSSEDAMTGRGLRLVGALSTRWQAEPTAEGKMVWAELTGRLSPSELSPDDLINLWADDFDLLESSPPRHEVVLGEVPTDLLLAAKSHVDNLVREFTLAARGAQSGVSGAVPRPLAALIEAVVSRFAEARQAIKRQAIVAAESGRSHVSLHLSLPAGVAEAGEDYLRALDEADSYCRAARLLTLETQPQHRVFRQWYVGEIVKQLRAAADGRPATNRESFEQRLLREVDTVALARRATERVARLFDVSAALGRAATTEAVAQAVVEHGVAALGASGGGILLAGDTDRLFVPATVGYDEDVVARLRAESRDAELPAAVALRTGQSVWLESAEERDARFPLLSALERQAVSACAVPLAIGDHRLGALRFSFAEARLFDQEERRFVEALAAQTAQALDRAQLYEMRADLSRRFQRSLLPGDMVAPPGVEVAGSYHPLGDGMELGGDTFDLWSLGADLWGVAIADAAGTGPEAAALTAMIRFTLRALSMSDVEPASVLRDLNRALLAAGAAGADGERFCTVIFGVLTPTPTGAVLTLAGGGHPYPLVRRAAGGIEEVAVGGSLLGVLPDVPVGIRTVTLGRGDTLVLYTDGAIEARRDGVMFGVERLADVVGAAPTGAQALADAVEEAVVAHVGGTMTDDLAVLVVRVLA